MEKINKQPEDTVIISAGLWLTSNTISWGSAQPQVEEKKKREKNK